LKFANNDDDYNAASAATILLASCSQAVGQLAYSIKNAHYYTLHSRLYTVSKQFTNFYNFCCAMLCKRGLCRHAVSVCVSVTFVHSIKTNKHIFKIFTSSGSQAILLFPYQRAWQYTDRTPLTRRSNAGAVGRNRDSEPISGLTAWC